MTVYFCIVAMATQLRLFPFRCSRGFEDRSYMTLEIPGTVKIASTISFMTCEKERTVR